MGKRENAAKELRKLEKRLALARATETRRLIQLTTAQESKGRKEVAKRQRQAADAAGEVAALVSKLAGRDGCGGPSAAGSASRRGRWAAVGTVGSAARQGGRRRPSTSATRPCPPPHERPRPRGKGPPRSRPHRVRRRPPVRPRKVRRQSRPPLPRPVRPEAGLPKPAPTRTIRGREVGHDRQASDDAHHGDDAQSRHHARAPPDDRPRARPPPGRQRGGPFVPTPAAPTKPLPDPGTTAGSVARTARSSAPRSILARTRSTCSSPSSPAIGLGRLTTSRSSWGSARPWPAAATLVGRPVRP